MLLAMKSTVCRGWKKTLIFLFTALSYTLADSVGEYFWILLQGEKKVSYRRRAILMVQKCDHCEEFTCQKIHTGSSDAVWAPVTKEYLEQH